MRVPVRLLGLLLLLLLLLLLVLVVGHAATLHVCLVVMRALLLLRGVPAQWRLAV